MKKLIAALLVAAFAGGALAHGAGHAHEGPVKKEQQPWGIAGEAKDARRTLEVRMLDTMRFEPDHFEVKQGDTVKLVIHNAGQLQHELVIGTPKALEEHAALMVKFPDMEHDEPHMAHVPPGGTGELVWRFNRPGDFKFACLIAGHYQAGMTGTIHVARARR